MRDRTKVVIFVCFIAGLVALIPIFEVPLFPLPQDEQGSCIIYPNPNDMGPTMLCSPDTASLSYLIFGQGYLSSRTGQQEWCTHVTGPGGSGYTCP